MLPAPPFSPVPDPPARQAERHPYAQAHSLPVRLLRQATPPQGLAYSLISFWETRLAGRVQRTTLEKSLLLHYAPPGPGPRPALLTYQAAPPVLHQPDPSALERALLLLSALYQDLVLELAPTGQFQALRNHAAVLQTWESIQAELVRRSGGEDEVTQLLLGSVAAQLQDPAYLLESLRYDYAFQFLLPDLYNQRWESGWRYGGPARVFPRFFADADLWFSDRLELLAPPAAGQVALQLRGALDPTRTDLAAVAQQVAAEQLAAGVTLAAPDPAMLRGTLDATYHFDEATGWPLLLDASVRCQAGPAYSKEYFIRLEQLPPA